MSKRINPTAEELIIEEEEDFIKRFEVELIKSANEGIAFNLPAIVVDHVADTEELELSQVQNQEVRERRHQRGGGFEIVQNSNYPSARRRRRRSFIRTELSFSAS